MKKTILLLSLCITVVAAKAQLGITLTGTTYNETFDNQGSTIALSSGCPGWHVYSACSSTTLGHYEDSGAVATYNYNDADLGGSATFGSYYDTTDCAADVFGHGFKNSASADAGMATNTCVMQQAQANRALAVRPSSAAGFDPGTAFCLHLNNTAGMHSFNCNFRLQSLDETSNRVSTWMVDYGFGLSPTTFTAATTGAGDTLTTGGYNFANHYVSVNFGSALDDMSSDVWIRISTQISSSGSGNRTTTGIDDFNMSWTNIPTGVQNVAAQNELTLTVLGDATSDKINMLYSTEEAGNYSLIINDITGRILHTEAIDATNGGNVISINGLHLAAGIYIATMQNSNSKAVTRIAVQ